MKHKSVLNNQSVERRRKKNVFVVFRVLHRVGSGLFKVLFLFTVIVMISLSFLFLYHCLLKSPYMKLEQVHVAGVDEEMRYELIQLCGLNSDLSLMSLNLHELKQKMEGHPLIRSVKLERRFPHTLIIQAEKQNPAALVVMDKIYYMNRWGEVFKEVYKSEEIDFPVITGVGKQGPEAREQLEWAAQIIRTLEPEKGLWSLKKLSEVHVRKDGHMSLYFSHLPAEIRLMCRDIVTKMHGLKKVADHLSQTGRIHQVTSIDLNHVDGAVVSFRKS